MRLFTSGPFVSDCHRAKVSTWLKVMRERGNQPRTIANELAALLAVLSALAREGRFPMVELEALRILKPKERAKARHGNARWLTRPEVDRLVEAAELVAPRLAFPIRVASLTGARVGELARMSREDFDLGPKPFVRITELEEFGERGSAKTGKRTVPVCAELKALLLDRDPQGWLFPSDTGRKSGRKPRAPFLNTWTLEAEFQYVRRAARLPEDVTFTTLRHTRGSWWLQAGVSIYKVAAWLGHQVRVCEQHYAGLAAYDEDCERSSGAALAPPAVLVAPVTPAVAEPVASPRAVRRRGRSS